MSTLKLLLESPGGPGGPGGPGTPLGPIGPIGPGGPLRPGSPFSPFRKSKNETNKIMRNKIENNGGFNLQPYFYQNFVNKKGCLLSIV